MKTERLKNAVTAALISGVLITVLFLFSSVSHAGDALHLKVGESKIISGKDITRVGVVNPDILDVAVLSDHEIFILGKAQGNTRLNIWSGNRMTGYDVLVTESVDDFRKKLKEAIGTNNITTVVAKNTAVLKGVVDSQEKYDLAGKLAAIYFEKVENLLSIKQTEKKSNSKIKNQSNEIEDLIALDGVRVYKNNGGIILDGFVNSEEERKRAESIALNFSDKVVNLLKFSEPLQILIEAKIIEIEEDDANNIGVTWSGNTSAAAGEISYSEKIRDTVGTLNSEDVLARMNPFKVGELMRTENMNAKLKALIDNNRAKLISAPKLLTMNNEKATLNVGGEVPVSQVSEQDGRQVTSISWRSWGIIMDILPSLDSEKNITIDVDTEVSSIGQIYNVAGSEVPSINTKKATTKVCVKEGTMIVISGLINRETRKNVQKIPFLSDIPGIGKIFRQVSEQEKKKELLIFLTPYIVKSDGSMLQCSRSGNMPEL